MSEINPNDFFNLDEAGKMEDEPETPSNEDNVYAEFESTLNLPIGSTKDAIAASKQLISKTKALAVQADMVEFQEHSIDNVDAEDINDEVLRKDRARIRREAHELYDMGKNMLTYMYNQLKSQIDPGDKMWAACSSMISSVTKSLADLNKMTKEFREENDRDIEKKIQSGQIEANDNQEYEFTPEQTNKIIAQWTAENEKKIQDELKQLAAERGTMTPGILENQSEEEPKQIENKG